MTTTSGPGGFSAIRVVGGLLPPDVLSSVVDGSAAGLGSGDFHLGGERPREAAARTWTYLTGVYRRYRDDIARLRDDEPAVGITRERWLTQVLAALDYGRVAPTGVGGLRVDDRTFPVSHLWGSTPIHLLGWNVPLDRRTAGVPGAAHRAPHAMVQELLNRSDAHQWAILSNGRLLRLLRDSTSLTGQAYVEFDLESMFDADLYADFALLYLLVHQSRVEVARSEESVLPCWLERWRTTAVSQGVRALELLRGGVQDALATLGTGFLRHPDNTALRQGLESGEVRLQDLHASLLRLAYRLIFWAVAEDREALLDPAADLAAEQRYRAYFSSARLRDLARRRQGTPHHDLWDAVTLVLNALARIGGEPRLGLPGLGGLFAVGPADVLAGATVDNTTLLSAVRSLSVVQPKGQARRTVDFRHLGAEELGSIYESLLELVPRRDPVGQTFSLETAAGNDRKTTGSYYTPSDLVDLVLDTALDPVLDDAEKQPNAEAALLAVTVCDPAIGSGHFMVAAARRIATRLARVRTEEVDPTPATLSDAMHEVVARCIYGVDVNPMAADLAKVSLWLEAMSPGRPLSFLDHHIKVGNALLGTTPALLASGIPDAAYAALIGDDKAVAKSWRAVNAQERAGQDLLIGENMLPVDNAAALAGTQEIARRASGSATLSDVAWAAERYATLQADEKVVASRQVADAWCAAFLAPKTAEHHPITQGTLEEISSGIATEALVAAIRDTAARHRLFHWHLEFPEIFRVVTDDPAGTKQGWVGGFSAMLGNPPWETLQMSEKEYFASREPGITAAPNAAARKKMITALTTSDPQLAADFQAESRRGEADNLLIRGSGRFPLTARGKINTYSIFAEHFRSSLADAGRCGIITQTGIATDATAAAFFADTIRTERLAAFYDFENEAKIFPQVHHTTRFAVSSITGGERVKEVKMSFINRHVADAVSRRFELSAVEVGMLNPNLGTLPIFRTRRDADIALACYRRYPIIIRDGDLKGNPWGLRFSQGLFNMSTDSGLFRTATYLRAQGATFDGWAWRRGDQQWLPLYEGKMVSHWNNRYATYEGATEAQLNVGTLPRLTIEQLDDPAQENLARYWVDSATVSDSTPLGWDRKWFLGWRDITGQEKWRTFVPSVLPLSAVGHVNPVAISTSPNLLPLLQATWSSLLVDFLARQKLSGTHLTYGVLKQLACPTPQAFDEIPFWSSDSLSSFVRPRVLELTYTSHRIEPYAADILETDTGAPFRWLPERRAQITAELDAAMFHLYGLDRADAKHVLSSFPVVRKSEERDLGEFRTERLVLAAYDAMGEAARTKVPFVSLLNPSPGKGPRHENRPE